MDVSVQRTNKSIQNGGARSDRMDVSVRRQPISTEWISIRRTDGLIGKVAPVLTEWMCLFRRVAPVTTDRFPPILI